MNKPIAVPRSAPPAFVAAARAEFDALRRAQPDLQFIDAIFADICGTLRGKRLPIDEAGRLFESGLQIPKSIYLMDAHGEMTNPFGRGVSDGDPDDTAWPIPETLAPVFGAGAPRAQVLMTLRSGEGAPDPAEPLNSWTLPALIVRPPLKVLTPAKFSVPLPYLITPPVPEMMPE